jgi:hypothetical protein
MFLPTEGLARGMRGIPEPPGRGIEACVEHPGHRSGHHRSAAVAFLAPLRCLSFYACVSNGRRYIPSCITWRQAFYLPCSTGHGRHKGVGWRSFVRSSCLIFDGPRAAHRRSTRRAARISFGTCGKGVLSRNRHFSCSLAPVPNASCAGTGGGSAARGVSWPSDAGTSRATDSRGRRGFL